MPSWFSKVFKGPEEASTAAPAAPQEIITFELDEDKPKKQRRIVNAPILVDAEEASAFSENINIKARINEATETGIFMVDRPVLDGFSFYAPDRATANAQSPLAAALFDLDSISSVTIHGMTITVKRGGRNNDSYDVWAKAVAAQIRAQLKSGMPVVNPEWLDKVPDEATLRAALQEAIDKEINPGIAGHSGNISITDIQGNTVFIKMGGGCQGCAASSVTLRQGVETTFRTVAPHMGALLDETDHTAGENPYFKSLPAGMGV